MATSSLRPGTALLGLRKGLGLFANLRPVTPHPKILDASPIKAEVLHGVDIMVVRELTGGIYFGDKTRTATEATDVCRYTVEEIERVVRLAAGSNRTRSAFVSVVANPITYQPRPISVTELAQDAKAPPSSERCAVTLRPVFGVT